MLRLPSGGFTEASYLPVTFEDDYTMKQVEFELDLDLTEPGVYQIQVAFNGRNPDANSVASGVPSVFPNWLVSIFTRILMTGSARKYRVPFAPSSWYCPSVWDSYSAARSLISPPGVHRSHPPGITTTMAVTALGFSPHRVHRASVSVAGFPFASVRPPSGNCVRMGIAGTSHVPGRQRPCSAWRFFQA